MSPLEEKAYGQHKHRPNDVKNECRAARRNGQRMPAEVIRALRRRNPGKRVDSLQHTLGRGDPACLSASAQVIPELSVMRAGLFKQPDGGGRDVLDSQFWHDSPQLGESAALQIDAARVFR